MYLIIGASGYLGRYCIKNVLDLTSDSIVATYSGQQPAFCHERVKWVKVDVCDFAAVEALNAQLEEGTKCIYLAAYHHPDKVQANPRLAWNINITALSHAVNAWDKVSSLYYSSTDTVYGEGSKEHKFLETDPLKPVNLYGQHKVLAEQIVLAKGYNVVRFPFIFGPSLVEGCPHFFDRIREDLAGGKTVEMFSDSFRSTLSFDQCARYLVMLMENEKARQEKIVNVAGDDVLSKYDAAVALADKFGLDKSLIRSVSVAQTQGIFVAKRASSAILDNSKLKQILGLPQVHLEL